MTVGETKRHCFIKRVNIHLIWTFSANLLIIIENGIIFQFRNFIIESIFYTLNVGFKCNFNHQIYIEKICYIWKVKYSEAYSHRLCTLFWKDSSRNRESKAMAVLSYYLGSFPTENMVALLTQFHSVVFFIVHRCRPTHKEAWHICVGKGHLSYFLLMNKIPNLDWSFFKMFAYSFVGVLLLIRFKLEI